MTDYLIWVVVIISFPYLLIIFLRGIKTVKEELNEIASGFNLLLHKIHKTAEDRMNRELDKIEKRQTGKITQIPESAEGQWVGSPTPKEESKQAEIKLLEEQRKLKEKLEKEEESDQ